MDAEVLAKIEASDGTVRLALKSGGKPSYQYVYRAAKGVYWDNEAGVFTFDAGTEMNIEAAIRHVIAVIREEMNLNDLVDDEVTWINVPMEVRNAIRGISI